MQKIYVVEDDDNIRVLIEYALKTADFESMGFVNGCDFLAACQRELPSLVLLDIMLPDMNGMQIIKKLREEAQTRKLPVIFLTAKGAEVDRISGLDAGADDYVVKPFSVLELISRVKAVLRRFEEEEPKDEPLSFREITLDLNERRVLVNGEEVALTFKEFELLAYMLGNQGQALSRERLLDHVWGYSYEGESRTVDTHVMTLRQKLLSAGDHIKTVRNVGYKIGERNA